MTAFRNYDDKYARLALRFHSRIGKKVGGLAKAQSLWNLADYLQEQDTGGNKHEQHLLMLASKWVKNLPAVTS